MERARAIICCVRWASARAISEDFGTAAQEAASGHSERPLPKSVCPGAWRCGALVGAQSNPLVPVPFPVCARFQMQLQWQLPLSLWH